MEIAASQRNRQRAHTAAALVDRTCVVAAGDRALVLCLDAERLRRFHRAAHQLFVVDSASVHHGDDRTVAERANLLLGFDLGDLGGGSGFKHQSKCRIERICRRFGAAQADLLLHHKGKIRVIFQIALDQFYHHITAEAVVYRLGVKVGFGFNERTDKLHAVADADDL